MSYVALLRESGLKGPLLTPPDAQPKVVKNSKHGFLTAALHLLPANLSGFEVCPGRSPGCTNACLHSAGSPVYFKVKTSARLARTKLYFERRSLFIELLMLEIAAHRRKALAAGLKPAVRLNATSDIFWERAAPGIFSSFPDVSFYDYTKVINRMMRPRPANYHLTFSLHEANLDDATRAARAGLNVAVVFPTANLPATFRLGELELPVINGDEHDYRPVDPRGVVIGLKAKGKAKVDQTGFMQMAA